MRPEGKAEPLRRPPRRQNHQSHELGPHQRRTTPATDTNTNSKDQDQVPARTPPKKERQRPPRRQRQRHEARMQSALYPLGLSASPLPGFGSTFLRAFSRNFSKRGVPQLRAPHFSYPPIASELPHPSTHTKRGEKKVGKPTIGGFFSRSFYSRSRTVFDAERVVVWFVEDGV